jgi:hypothetical protein
MCAATGASRRISQVVLGGNRAQWITAQHGRPALLAIDAIGCKEWVIERLSDQPLGMSLGAIAGEGTTLAFALIDRTSRGAFSAIERVTGGYRDKSVYRVPGAVTALATDGLRMAVLTADGRVYLRGYEGRGLLSRLVRHATRIALHGDDIVTATSTGRLNIYSTSSGALRHSWRLPDDTTSRLSIEYGIAVVTAGRNVYAVRLDTGRTARLALAPSRALAKIGAAGVVYAFSTKGRGTAELVPMSTVEAALR